MTNQPTHETNISRRSVLGGGAAAIALTSVAALGATDVPAESDRGAGILKLISEYEEVNRELYDHEDEHFNAVGDIGARLLQKLETHLHAIDNYQCNCVEDVLYQMAFFVECDAESFDKTTDLCEFEGGKERFTKIMKSFAHLTNITPLDTVKRLAEPDIRLLGY
ncbi:twin-arginine translocation signal domain-containing protein [Kordiimonas sp.]|uniref:twin-arginine translocation signal domain-containing protein n=1 Tax=Kordiimonas sp. TaxID=1970157 RepID=UPI003B52577B